MQQVAALVCLLFALLPSGQAQTPATGKPGASQPSTTAKAGAAQAPVKKNPLAAYAGNWVGTFEGKPWMVLNLALAEPNFSGTLRRPESVEFSDNGELKKISEVFVTAPVTDAVVNPDGLLLTFKGPETQESSRYMMKLTSETTAEIKMLAMTMPPGMPKPKPWKLTRSGAGAPQKSPTTPQKQ